MALWCPLSIHENSTFCQVLFPCGHIHWKPIRCYFFDDLTRIVSFKQFLITTAIEKENVIFFSGCYCKAMKILSKNDIFCWKNQFNLLFYSLTHCWYTLSIIYSINLRGCPPLGIISLGQAVHLNYIFNTPHLLLSSWINN